MSYVDAVSCPTYTTHHVSTNERVIVRHCNNHSVFSPCFVFLVHIIIIVLWSCLIAQNVVKMCPLCILVLLFYRKLNPRCNYVWSVNWILPHRATSSHPWTRTRWTLRSSSLSARTSPVCGWWTPRARSWGMRWATGRSTRRGTIGIGLREYHRIILRYGFCLINYGESLRNIPIQG